MSQNNFKELNFEWKQSQVSSHITAEISMDFSKGSSYIGNMEHITVSFNNSLYYGMYVPSSFACTHESWCWHFPGRVGNHISSYISLII